MDAVRTGLRLTRARGGARGPCASRTGPFPSARYRGGASAASAAAASPSSSNSVLNRQASSSEPLLKPSSRPPTLESEGVVRFPFLERGRALPSNLSAAPYGGGCLVLVDKPKGWTSFDVCNKLRNELRRAYGVKKVGHTGTLDPMATGLLLLCVGRATKMVQTFTGADKRYEGTCAHTSERGAARTHASSVSSRPRGAVPHGRGR